MILVWPKNIQEREKIYILETKNKLYQKMRPKKLSFFFFRSVYFFYCLDFFDKFY